MMSLTTTSYLGAPCSLQVRGLGPWSPPTTYALRRGIRLQDQPPQAELGVGYRHWILGETYISKKSPTVGPTVHGPLNLSI